MSISKQSLNDIVTIAFSLLAVYIVYSTLYSIELIALVFLLGGILYILYI
jgi:hypothetical protein